jgi:drug/metabolite transporter (DMT)-like permease
VPDRPAPAPGPTTDPDPTPAARATPTGAIALVALSAACFGAVAIFVRQAYDSGADLWGILLPRFVIAAVVFVAIARLLGHAMPPRSKRAGLAAMGAAYVAQAICYFGALRYIPAGLAALLLYLFPLFVVLLSRAFGHEPITRTRVAALLASLVGTGLAIGPQAVVDGGLDWRGVALGLAAALVYAGYIVGGARATRGLPPFVAAAAIMSHGALFVAAIVGLRLAFGLPVAFVGDALGWGAILAIALVSTVVAVSTFFAGLARLGPARTSVISTLEPVVTVALAALLLGERLHPMQLAGGALVLAAATLLALERPPATPKA